MFSRPLLLVGFLAAAFIIPYVATDKQFSASVQKQWQGWWGSGTSSELAYAPELGNGFPISVVGGSQAGSAVSPGSSLLNGPPVVDLAEVIRLDVPPSFVTSRWKRVTTVTSETGLRGMRVPLVTGTRPDDLAGSLTYYFDQKQQLQRLTFHGVSGDESRLVALVCQQFGLRPMPSLRAGIYLSDYRDKPLSALHVNHLPVVTADKPQQGAEILLELNTPQTSAKLSEEITELLRLERQAKQW